MDTAFDKIFYDHFIKEHGSFPIEVLRKTGVVLSVFNTGVQYYTPHIFEVLDGVFSRGHILKGDNVHTEKFWRDASEKMFAPRPKLTE